MARSIVAQRSSGICCATRPSISAVSICCIDASGRVVIILLASLFEVVLNLRKAALAPGQGVSEVAMLVTDAEANSFGDILEEDGVDRLFPGEVDIMAWDHQLATGTATKREHVVEEGEDTEWLTRANREVLPLAVIRTGEVKPFTGDVRAGDRVIYVTTDRNRVTAMAGTDAAG